MLPMELIPAPRTHTHTPGPAPNEPWAVVWGRGTIIAPQHITIFSWNSNFESDTTSMAGYRLCYVVFTMKSPLDRCRSTRTCTSFPSILHIRARGSPTPVVVYCRTDDDDGLLPPLNESICFVCTTTTTTATSMMAMMVMMMMEEKHTATAVNHSTAGAHTTTHRLTTAFSAQRRVELNQQQ